LFAVAAAPEVPAQSRGARTLDPAQARLKFGPSEMTLRDVQENTNAERTTQVYRFLWPKYPIFSGNLQYVRIRGPILKSVDTPADAERAFRDLWPRHRANPPKDIDRLEVGPLAGFFGRRTSAVACAYFFVNDPSPAYAGSIQGYIAGEFCAAQGNSVTPEVAESFVAAIRTWARSIRID
jgi:hypothetical protein